MAKPVSFLSVSYNLLWVLMTWTFGFLGIVTLINVGKIFFGSSVDSMYSAGYVAANVYMLVIGIISINFLPYFVENGVTRKKYFIGNVIAGAGLSVIIPILIYLISLLEKGFVTLFTSIALNEHTLKDVAVDIDSNSIGNVIGDIIQAVLLTPYINPETNLVFSLAMFALHIFVFYMIGWMIAAAFYRLDIIGGLLFIAIGIAFLGVKDSMVRLALDIPLFHSFSALSVAPENLAYPIVFAVILATILIIRGLTKRAPIKL